MKSTRVTFSTNTFPVLSHCKPTPPSAAISLRLSKFADNFSKFSSAHFGSEWSLLVSSLNGLVKDSGWEIPSIPFTLLIRFTGASRGILSESLRGKCTRKSAETHWNRFWSRAWVSQFKFYVIKQDVSLIIRTFHLQTGVSNVVFESIGIEIENLHCPWSKFRTRLYTHLKRSFSIL